MLVALMLFLAQLAHGALIYEPAKLDAKTAKIVVVIHGCLQSAEAMAMGTGWDRIADKENLLMIYPQVPTGSHALDCWGWFAPENQSRQSGQLKQVYDLLQSARKRYNLASAPAYAVGISSGAATVAGLLACFPEAFRAGAIHSGPPYGFVKSEAAAQILLATAQPSVPSSARPCDPKAYKGRLMVVQGSADKVVNQGNATSVIRDFFDQISESRTTGSMNGATYQIIDFKKQDKLVARTVLVNGLDHAWSGFTLNLAHADMLGPNAIFPTKLPFFSAQGPSATDMIWEFFSLSQTVSK